MHIWCILQFYVEAGKWGHLSQYNQEFPQLFCFWIEWKHNDIVQLKMFLNWMKAQWRCSTQNVSELNESTMTLFNSKCFWIEWKHNDVVQLKMLLNWMKAQWHCSTQNVSEFNESTMTLFNSVQPSDANMHNFINTLRPRQNGRHFPDDSFKWIFLNENVWTSIEASLKFVAKGPINNIPALVQVMAWRRPGDKPLSEPMMVSLLTHTVMSLLEAPSLIEAPPKWVCTLSRNSSAHTK